MLNPDSARCAVGPQRNASSTWQRARSASEVSQSARRFNRCSRRLAKGPKVPDKPEVSKPAPHCCGAFLLRRFLQWGRRAIGPRRASVTRHSPPIKSSEPSRLGRPAHLKAHRRNGAGDNDSRGQRKVWGENQNFEQHLSLRRGCRINEPKLWTFQCFSLTGAKSCSRA